jgi:hypothetical protein
MILPTALLAGLVVAAEKEDEPKVEVKVVKYNDLCKEIIGLKGKVVVVDYWAGT